jgi:hypothetical protein
MRDRLAERGAPEAAEMVRISKLPMLVPSMHDEDAFAERVLKAGGHGYVLKEAGG